MSATHADWRERAACLGVDPELFFPVGAGLGAAEQIADAKRICAGCPVIDRCRELAVRNGYEGVWGGTDDAERRWARAARRQAAEPQSALAYVPDRARYCS